MKTHALILDTMSGSFSLLHSTEAKVAKAFKVWKTKLLKSQWIEVPSTDDLPNMFNTTSILSMRVVPIPETIAKGLKKLEDPKMKMFLDRANNFASNFEEATPSGRDLLDGGYK